MRAGPWLADYRSQCPPSAEVTFAFFDPYAVGLHLVPTALDALRAEGFEIIDQRFVSYTASRIETVYATNNPLTEHKTWAAPSEVYLIGPSVAVLLRLPGGDASQTLRRFKGPADPQRRSASDLRSRLGSPGRALSLMHSSDSAEVALREAASAFDPREIVKLATNGWESTNRSGSPFESLPECVLGPAWRPTPHEFLVVLRLRIANELELVDPIPDATIALWRSSLTDIRAAGAASTVGDLYRDLVKRERGLDQPLHHLRHDRCQPDRFEYAVDLMRSHAALDCLLDVTSYPRFDIGQLLADIGAYVRNPFERLLLDTALLESE